jgi:hypothetical protein
MPTINCNFCTASYDAKPSKDGRGKLRPGWKEHQDKIYCPKCWKGNYSTRAITFPVAGPFLDAGHTKQQQDDAWKQLREHLLIGWRQVAQLKNWAVSELFARDYRRTPEMEKAPKDYQPPYLYGLLTTKADPQLSLSAIDSGVRADLCQQVIDTYKSQRYEILWQQKRSLANYKVPQPYPIRAADWKAYYGPDNVLLVEAKIAGKWFVLRLRGGHQFARQLKAVKQLIEGKARQSELAFYAVRANPDGDNRPNVYIEGEPHRLMAKLVMMLPKTTNGRKKEGTFILRTDKDALLYGVIDGRQKPFIYNADHIRRKIAAHQRRRQRLSEDTKFEKRWPKEVRERMLKSQDVACKNQNNWLKSFVHETTSMVANFAERQGVSTLRYDDSERGYVSQFPWFNLKAKLKEKCEKKGIEFVASGEVEAKTEGPLANDESEGEG